MSNMMLDYFLYINLNETGLSNKIKPNVANKLVFSSNSTFRFLVIKLYTKMQDTSDLKFSLINIS